MSFWSKITKPVRSVVKAAEKTVLYPVTKPVSLIGKAIKAPVLTHAASGVNSAVVNHPITIALGAAAVAGGVYAFGAAGGAAAAAPAAAPAVTPAVAAAAPPAATATAAAAFTGGGVAQAVTTAGTVASVAGKAMSGSSGWQQYTGGAGLQTQPAPVGGGGALSPLALLAVGGILVVAFLMRR